MELEEGWGTEEAGCVRASTLDEDVLIRRHDLYQGLSRSLLSIYVDRNTLQGVRVKVGIHDTRNS